MLVDVPNNVEERDKNDKLSKLVYPREVDEKIQTPQAPTLLVASERCGEKSLKHVYEGVHFAKRALENPTSRGSQQDHQLQMLNLHQQQLMLKAQSQGSITPLDVQLKGKPMESTQETILGKTPNLVSGYDYNLVTFEAKKSGIGAGDMDFNSVSNCKQWKGKEEPSLSHHSNEITDLEINIYEDVTRYNETRCDSRNAMIKGDPLLFKQFEEWRRFQINRNKPSNPLFWAFLGAFNQHGPLSSL
eukprot:Gb_06565 [translate_table: standard]